VGDGFMDLQLVTMVIRFEDRTVLNEGEGGKYRGERKEKCTLRIFNRYTTPEAVEAYIHDKRRRGEK